MTTWVRAAAILLTCTAAIAGAGCSRSTRPEFSVAGATLRDETKDGYVLEFALDARNDNPDPLPLRELRYSLTLDGREVFRGVRSAQTTLRRFGTQRITVPAAVSLAPGDAPPRGLVRYVLQGEVTYLTPGAIAQVLFDIAVRRPRASFRQEGELSIEAGGGAR